MASISIGIKEKEEAEMNNKEENEKMEKVVLSFIDHAD